MNARSAIRPLRMIFWGLLLVILDMKIRFYFGGSYRIDLLNDTIGMIFVLVGVSRIASSCKGMDISAWFTYVLVCAWLTFGMTILEVFDLENVSWYRFIGDIISLASAIAAALFCFAMRYVALDAQLLRSAERWKWTSITVLVWWVGSGIAANIIALAVYLSWMQNPSQWLTIQIGSALTFGAFVALALLFCVLFLPLISFWRSTSHMQRELGSLPPVESVAAA